jgi:hypothetical protein
MLFRLIENEHKQSAGKRYRKSRRVSGLGRLHCWTNAAEVGEGDTEINIQQLSRDKFR